jgi:hypothetical protein
MIPMIINIKCILFIINGLIFNHNYNNEFVIKNEYKVIKCN